MNSAEQELPGSVASEGEVRRLSEENARLRNLLLTHGIPVPPAEKSVLQPPQASNSALEARKPGVATAEQRIALFRSLFRGRDDIYAIRWENDDGRAGYMPKADRDWKSYLSAKDEDRKKVDCLTRTYRPLTDDVVRSHLVGENTAGIYPLLQDETCWLLAVDFDKKAWQEDTAAFLTACRELSVPAALERSRSGKGTLQQYVGRLHRLHDAKRVVRVFDYVDSSVLMLSRMYARRLKGYSAIGYKICNTHYGVFGTEGQTTA